jgi:hypothetical protein
LPFFRNPDFQVRDFGAAAPVVSTRRNELPSRSRQPVIVTGLEEGDVGCEAFAAAALSCCDSTARAVGALAVCTIVVGVVTAAVVTTAGCSDDVTVTRSAAARMQIPIRLTAAVLTVSTRPGMRTRQANRVPARR